MEVVNFRTRFARMREDIFGTQQNCAEWFAKKGLIEKPKQSTISNYEDPAQGEFSSKLKRKFEALREKGVNPEYFWNPRVTHWKLTPPLKSEAAKSIQAATSNIEHIVETLEEAKALIVKLRAERDEWKDKYIRALEEQLKDKKPDDGPVRIEHAQE